MVKIEKFEFPDELYYTEDHTWAKVEEGGSKVRVGLDAFGQDLAGRIIFVRVRRKGSPIEQGRAFAKIETGKWVGPLKSPVSGSIIEVNSKVESKPVLINEDPYGEGWIVVVKPSSLEKDLKNLYYGDAVADWIRREIEEKKKKEEK